MDLAGPPKITQEDIYCRYFMLVNYFHYHLSLAFHTFEPTPNPTDSRTPDSLVSVTVTVITMTVSAKVSRVDVDGRRRRRNLASGRGKIVAIKADDCQLIWTQLSPLTV